MNKTVTPSFLGCGTFLHNQAAYCGDRIANSMAYVLFLRCSKCAPLLADLLSSSPTAETTE